ncbi:transcription termination factor 1 [Caerostris extrusa]|uniref:Transcription termination factor 1 n=1 Tax=Caerostris extrusa TaxID=172846 RepID=A0AAV4UIH8_CAEEX|nr:transcription termination factor 1 [Caerostris extrusa]
MMLTTEENCVFDLNSSIHHKRKHKKKKKENTEDPRIEIQELDNTEELQNLGKKSHTRKKDKHPVVEEFFSDEKLLEGNAINEIISFKKRKHKKHERNKIDYITGTEFLELNEENLNKNHQEIEDYQYYRGIPDCNTITEKFSPQKTKHNSIEDTSTLEIQELDNTLELENLSKHHKQKKWKHRVEEADLSTETVLEANVIDEGMTFKKRKFKKINKEDTSRLEILELNVKDQSHKDITTDNAINGKYAHQKRKHKKHKNNNKETMHELENLELHDNENLDIKHCKHQLIEGDQSSPRKILDANTINEEINHQKRKHKKIEKDYIENTSEIEELNISEETDHEHQFIEENNIIKSTNSGSNVINEKLVNKKRKHKKSHSQEIEDIFETENAMRKSGNYLTNKSKQNSNFIEAENQSESTILECNTTNELENDLNKTLLKKRKHKKSHSTITEKNFECERNGIDAVIGEKNLHKNKRNIPDYTAAKSDIRTELVDNLNSQIRNSSDYMINNMENNSETEMSELDIAYSNENNETSKEKKMSTMKDKFYLPEFDLFPSFDTSECPVMFPVSLLHENESLTSLKAEQRALLKENGVIINTGKWSKEEDAILKRNYQQFVTDFGVDDPCLLLGINQQHRKKEVQKFIKAKHLYVCLGKDLNNRPLRSIYMRARILLDPLRKKDKFNSEETIDLKHANELYGNKWTKIGELLSRTSRNCHSAIRWHKDAVNKGEWTAEEVNQLINAIKLVAKTEDISSSKIENISWDDVAKFVPTRNAFQCRKQWGMYLAWDPSIEKKKWKKLHFAKLIYLLKNKYSVNSEYDINWKELQKLFLEVSPSPIFLSRKWSYLKCQIPKGVELNFNKKLDFSVKDIQNI